MTKFQPDGWHTVTPRIIVPDPANPIAFIKRAFDGQSEFRLGPPAEIRTDDSLVMIGEVRALL